jgi:putative membrane protein
MTMTEAWAVCRVDHCWPPGPWVVAAAVAIAYAFGVAFTPAGRRWPWGKRLGFAGGLGTLALAFASPIDAWADGYSFAAHMLQHCLETLVAVPLLLWGTPGEWVAVAWRHPWAGAWRALARRPVAGLLVFNLVFSLCHWPAAYDALLAHPAWHLGVHALFFVTALWLWWPLLSPIADSPPLHPGVGMLYAFVAGVAMTPVFALVTFAGRPWYSAYVHVPRLWPWLSPLTDQVLGGILMKVVALLSYGGVFFGKLAQWFGEADRLRSWPERAAGAEVAPDRTESPAMFAGQGGRV